MPKHTCGKYYQKIIQVSKRVSQNELSCAGVLAYCKKCDKYVYEGPCNNLLSLILNSVPYKHKEFPTKGKMVKFFHRNNLEFLSEF